MNIPASLRKGDSVTWLDAATSDNLGNTISSSSWTLKYAIRGATVLDLTATASGDGWTTSITKVQSAALSAGTYYWQAYAESGSNRVTLGSGQITIEADLATASTGYDGRSQARQDLDAVQAAIRAMATGGAVQSYTIGSRQVEKMKIADLLVLESRLKLVVSREEKAESIKNGKGNPHNLFVRFK